MYIYTCYAYEYGIDAWKVIYTLHMHDICILYTVVVGIVCCILSQLSSCHPALLCPLIKRGDCAVHCALLIQVTNRYIDCAANKTFKPNMNQP